MNSRENNLMGEVSLISKVILYHGLMLQKLSLKAMRGGESFPMLMVLDFAQ